MICPECERLLAELESREGVYFEAIGRVGAGAGRSNPNQYFRLKKAVQDARLGLDLAVEVLHQHQDEHAVVN